MTSAHNNRAQRRTSLAHQWIVVLSIVGALGSGVMLLAHLGLDLDLLAPLGPGRLIVPAAIGFAIGTIAYTVVVFGAAQHRSWAWLTALLVNGLAVVVASIPFRGWFSVIAVAVAAMAIILLLMPGIRGSFSR